ncbi:MAG: hypothetical protein Aurels2KO_32800 [Aureliella sp.]
MPFVASSSALWRRHKATQYCVVLLLCSAMTISSGAQEPWERHPIDDSLRGADGVRLGDLNQDGLLDIVTGWEESGRVRVYLQPKGNAQQSGVTKSSWPAVTIGRAPSVEDAVFVDLNNDGRLDVLASCEGKEQALHCFFSPVTKDLLDASAWRTRRIATSVQRTRWMFALPSRENHGDIFVGSKHPNGQVARLELPSDGISVANANAAPAIRQLAPAAWIMSMVERDVDADGDLDLIYSDRKAEEQGVYWLECPDRRDASWRRHLIGGQGEEVLFLSVVGHGDHVDSIYVAAKPNRILKLVPPDSSEDKRRMWRQSEEFAASMTKFSRAKAVAAGDLTGDGQIELVYSCESADPPRQGVVLLTKEHNSSEEASSKEKWKAVGISGPAGIKFDLIELVDLDHDGDLDVLTCEERHAGRGLGVIWYENPLK